MLPFSDSKQAVQTCLLSTRWKHLWKHIPTLKLNSWRFSTKKLFATFMSKILTLRDSSTPLHALDLERDGIIEPKLLKMILNYLCHALTSLKLVHPKKGYDYTETLLPKSLNFPSLTNLYLADFTFYGGESGCAEPFTAFTKLNSLDIRFCNIKDARILNISNETLVDLTMVNISSNFAKIELYLPPSLCTFTFNGIPILKICGNGFSYVKHVDINAQIDRNSVEHALVLLSWLQDLANVESLIVTSTALQILSLVPDLLEVKLRSLCNLKSVKIRLKEGAKSLKEAAKLRKAIEPGLTPHPIPDGIVDFLRQNSPSAEVNITGCFHLKQVLDFVNGSKNTSYNSHFAAPASVAALASASEFASAAAPASAAPPNLQLCPTEEGDASSNENKVEIPQVLNLTPTLMLLYKLQ
ncbi:hypothetical protein QL285_021991 [Trifolium repens]|nr:hypothetical protein QL285_021991 [Trifolium repens]